MRHLLAFLLLALSASGAVPTTDLVARFRPTTGVTTNAGGYVSQVVDSVNGHVGSQSSEALKPKIWTVQGRPAFLFHYDPAVTTVSNNLTVATTLTNYTRDFSTFIVSHGSVRVNSKAFLTLHGFGAPVLQTVMNPSTYVSYMQAGANTDGTIKSTANVAVHWMTAGASGSRVGINYASQAQSALAATATAGATIGSYGPTKPFQGAMFDVLIYNKAKTQAEAEAIVTELIAEYGIVTNHTAVVVARGDSMTEMVGQTNLLSWPSRLADQFPQYRWINLGWGGKRIGTNGLSGTFYADDPTFMDAYYDASLPSWGLIHAGINDSSDGITGEQVFGRLTNWAAARKVTGWKIGVATLPARNTLTTYVSNYNALIRANTSGVFQFVSNSGSDPRLADSNDDTFFQSDNFHISNEGAGVVAAWWSTNIQTFIGRRWHVANSGNDSNPGTESLPFRTLQKGITATIPGDTLRILGGTYGTNFITVTNASSTSRITIEGVGWPVVGAGRANHAYHTIRGIRFTGETAPLGALFYVDTTATGLILETNRFWPSVTNAFYGIDAENGSIGTAPANITLRGNDFFDSRMHAIDAQGTNWLISGNRFESTNGWDAIRTGAFGVRITQNVFTNWSNLTTNSNHPDLIQAFLVWDGSNWIGGSAHVLIDRNLAVNCWGTQIGNVSDDGEAGILTDWEWRNNVFANGMAAINIAGPDFRWFNNLFYRVGVNTGGPLVFRHLSTGGEAHYGQVFGNVFIECGANPSADWQGWIGYEPGVTNTLVMDYNAVIGTGGGVTKGAAYTYNGWNANSLNGVNPLLINPDAYNFRPATNSPLIGVSTNLSARFTDDFDGIPRSNSWTMGPFQVAGVGSPPTPPPSGGSGSAESINATTVTAGSITGPTP